MVLLINWGHIHRQECHEHWANSCRGHAVYCMWSSADTLLSPAGVFVCHCVRVGREWWNRQDYKGEGRDEGGGFMFFISYLFTWKKYIYIMLLRPVSDICSTVVVYKTLDWEDKIINHKTHETYKRLFLHPYFIFIFKCTCTYSCMNSDTPLKGWEGIWKAHTDPFLTTPVSLLPHLMLISQPSPPPLSVCALFWAYAAFWRKLYLTVGIVRESWVITETEKYLLAE